MSCEHLNIYNNELHFLTPYLAKTTWLCLHDGCYKIKKAMTREELIAYGEKMQPAHRVMINCQTLEIFCTLCQKEVYDEIQAVSSSPSKQKKQKKIDPYCLRQHLIVPNQAEDLLFTGNSEYPPSFQKEKKGLCGLKINGINSYFNSVIHLLAYVPTMIDIALSVDPNKIQSELVKNILGVIATIWSGRYRVFCVKEIERRLLAEDHNFMSYSHKTPQYVLYFLLKSFIEEFYFDELPCSSPAIINAEYTEWTTSKVKRYSVVKQLFGGQCVFQQICSHCGHKSATLSRFECLKVTYESEFNQQGHFKGLLLGLIEQALNWKNTHPLFDVKLNQGELFCEQCKQKITQFYSYTNLPNNLILQFGHQLNGLNITLPDELDLFKFTPEAIKLQLKDTAIFDYVGCIHRKQKKFVTHVRNQASKKQFSFSDEIIQEEERPSLNIKLAIYKRRPNSNHQHLQKNIISCLEVKVNPIVPLPDFWSIFLKQHHHVPPLMNPFICPHGKIKNNLNMSKTINGPQKMPIQIYDYLLEVFGGRQISIQREDDFCEECQAEQTALEELKSSEKEMAAFADKLSHKKEWVLISRNWLEKWKQFVYGENRKGYKILGNPRPDPIDNTPLIQQDIINTHKKIAPEIWYFLQTFYGGGPRIPQKNYHPNIVVVSSVNLRLQSLKGSLNLLNKNKENESKPATEKFSPYKIEEVDQQHLNQG